MNNVLKKQNEEDTIKSLNKLKNLSKEKDASLLFTSRQARLIQCEIERLNNIIELAKYYIDKYMYENYAYCGSEDRLKEILSGNEFILKQLKELKEGR